MQPAPGFGQKQRVVLECLRIVPALFHPVGDLPGLELGDTAKLILLVDFYVFLVALEDGIACQGDGESEENKQQ
ncbi:MAG: hypothetical protein Q7T29_04080 [Gallionella sp.]|nr:hypothetical protein [Gallionella sp.]